MYLAVVPIISTKNGPRWAAADQKEKSGVIEYAVKMAAFPQRAQLDRLLAGGALQPCQIDMLAACTTTRGTA